jgi:hypothetical protein
MMIAPPSGELRCSHCREDWPTSCFRAAGSVNTRGTALVCGACFHERYGRTRRAHCTHCDRIMDARVEIPSCLSCQRQEPAPTECRVCGALATARKVTLRTALCSVCTRRKAA